MSSDAEAPQEPNGTPEAPEADSVREALVDELRAELGAGLLEAVVEAGDMWVRVAPSAWRDAARAARDRLGMRYFCFLAGIDWKRGIDLGGQKLWDPAAEPAPGQPQQAEERVPFQTGKAGGETRFAVMCRLENPRTHLALTLKTDAGDDAPVVSSLVEVFRGADWHERETWEMYGIVFDGHPGLRHIYLPGEFEGFPLRKDFPLLAREVKPWPGLVDVEGLPGEPAEGGDEESP